MRVSKAETGEQGPAGLASLELSGLPAKAWVWRWTGMAGEILGPRIRVLGSELLSLRIRVWGGGRNIAQRPCLSSWLGREGEEEGGGR